MMPDKSEATPYDRLDPDTVLQAVESTGLVTDGRMLALNSYENRVYQVGISGKNTNSRLSFLRLKFRWFRPWNPTGGP
jgi:Ser/Thr protein kinase RdoA (MazF antagonist)